MLGSPGHVVSSAGGSATPDRPLPSPSTHQRRGPSPIARLANNAALLRLLGRPLVRFLPVLSIGRLVLVSRHADVLDVLERDEDFTIAEVNADAMDRINGPFLLGMDRGELYTRERSALDGCVHSDDPARIRRTVSATAADLVAAAVHRGRIDVVQELARPAATRLAASYLGVPGPDEATMMGWMRLLFWEAFLNGAGDRAVRRDAERAATEFHTHVDRLVADRRAEAADTGHDDLLRRLVRVRTDGTLLSDEAVRRNIAGVVVGAVETTTKATAHAVDQLLRRPQALEDASRAARDGDVALVGQYVFEALRFNPLSPLLVRHAARPTVVAAGTRHERHVPAGRTVYAAVLAAMSDPRTFDDPRSFRHDRRPAADLHFGHGMHACFGRYVNLVSIPELVAALLRSGPVRRAPGALGRMRYEGPFPDRLVVEFGRPRTSDGGRA